MILLKTHVTAGRLLRRCVVSTLAVLALCTLTSAADDKPAAGKAGTTAKGAVEPPRGTIGSPAAALPREVMFRINGKDIPRDQFVAELNDVLGESYRDTFISHVLIDERAKSEGVGVSADEIEAHIQTNVDLVLRERFGGDANQMDAALKERGMSLDGWKKRLRLEGRYDLLLEKLVKKERKVPEETLRRMFQEKYGENGVQTKIRHVQKNVIVAASPEYTLQQFEGEKSKIDEETRARAEEALKKVQAGESFELVMAAYSDDPRKSAGGVLSSWKGRFGPELDEAAGKLNKGDVSGVIKGADGYRILQCTEITDSDEVHAQHILVASGGRGKGRTEAEAKKRAEEFLAQIKNGADFSQLARDNSDDPASATRGGDLGFFGRRAMVKPFEDAAFALDAGQISEAVKTNFGYHIIKVLEKRKSQDKTLRQIYLSTQFAIVKDRRLRPMLEGKAQAFLESLVAEIKKPGASLADIARTASDDVGSKGDGGLLKGYRSGTYGGGFDEAVRTMKAGEPPRIVKDAAGNLHIVQIDEVVKTDFEKVRGALENEEMARPPSPQERADYVNRLKEAATIVF